MAALLDLALLGGGVAGLWRAGVVAPGPLPSQQYDGFDYAADLIANHLPALAPFLIVVPTIGVLYGVVLHTLAGRTIGELLTGLHLIAWDGQSVGPIRALAHAVGTPVSLAPLLLGFVWGAVDPRRQTLAEYLSGTLLVAGRLRAGGR